MKAELFEIRDRETGNCKMDNYRTLKEAEACVERYEQEDRNNGDYTPNAYEIITRTIEEMAELVLADHPDARPYRTAMSGLEYAAYEAYKNDLITRLNITINYGSEGNAALYDRIDRAVVEALKSK